MFLPASWGEVVCQHRPRAHRAAWRRICPAFAEEREEERAAFRSRGWRRGGRRSALVRRRRYGDCARRSAPPEIAAADPRTVVELRLTPRSLRAVAPVASAEAKLASAPSRRDSRARRRLSRAASPTSSPSASSTPPRSTISRTFSFRPTSASLPRPAFATRSARALRARDRSGRGQADPRRRGRARAGSGRASARDRREQAPVRDPGHRRQRLGQDDDHRQARRQVQGRRQGGPARRGRHLPRRRDRAIAHLGAAHRSPRSSSASRAPTPPGSPSTRSTARASSTSTSC